MKPFILFAAIVYLSNAQAAAGDSIFTINKVHTLYLTFPYASFYDSLIKTNTTDVYLKVDVKFNDKPLSQVGVKVKGNSSFNNPSQKKSFKLDFNEFVAGQDLHGLKKLNFNNSFKDPTFMREKITNDFIRKFNAPAPRVSYCNVYMNNQLWGLYTIVENIDDEFCNQWFKNDWGNLFQGDPRGTLQWKGSTTQSLYTADYDLENNHSSNDWTNLIQLINTINNTPAQNFKNNLEQVFNTGNFVKQWAAMNLFSSFDSYIGSGHNYYLYHDSLKNKFEWVAWDNNEAFGSFKLSLTNQQIVATDIYYLNSPTSRPICDKMLKDSFYKQMYADTFCIMHRSFNNRYFDPIIDSLYSLIKPSVYADPKKFYTNIDFENNIVSDVNLPGPMGLNVFGLKNFIRDRQVAVNNSFAANKVQCINNSGLSEEKHWAIKYTIDNNTIIFENPYDVTIIDLQGKKVLTSKDTFSVSIDSVPAGYYFLLIGSPLQSARFKLFK